MNFRFVDVEMGEGTPTFGEQHALGSAYAEDGTMYASFLDGIFEGNNPRDASGQGCMSESGPGSPTSNHSVAGD